MLHEKNGTENDDPHQAQERERDERGDCCERELVAVVVVEQRVAERIVEIVRRKWKMAMLDSSLLIVVPYLLVLVVLPFFVSSGHVHWCSSWRWLVMQRGEKRRKKIP